MGGNRHSTSSRRDFDEFFHHCGCVECTTSTPDRPLGDTKFVEEAEVEVFELKTTLPLTSRLMRCDR